MLVSRIELENFRGLAALDVTLDAFTILLGENNLGKSSLIDALDICLSRICQRRSNVFKQTDFTRGADGTSNQIRITCTLGVPAAEEEQVSRAVGDVLGVLGDGSHQIIVRVIGHCDDTTGSVSHEVEFLNPAGQPLPARHRIAGLNGLSRLVSCHVLHAVRSASQDFRPTSKLLGPILSTADLPDDEIEELQSQLVELGERLVSAAPALSSVQTELEQLADFVELADDDIVKASPLPPDLRGLLRRTEISLTATDGSELPIASHGAGTQSLAVFFLFKVQAALARTAGTLLSLVCIEEPESHLHPWAASLLPDLLSQMGDQCVATTHSGDLVSQADLHSIRRLARPENDVHVFCVPNGLLSADDLRKIMFHILSQRGQLLFARGWLFVEGETEFHLLGPLSEEFGTGFRRIGVSIVPYANCGLDVLIRLADALGIPWHTITDGDDEGDKYSQIVRDLLNGRNEADLLTQWSEKDIETVFWENGFQDVFENECPPNAKNQADAEADPDIRRNRIIKSTVKKLRKPGCAEMLCNLVRTDQTRSCPDEVEDAINSVTDLME